MSRPDAHDAELHDLLSALLDGELSAAEEAEVRAYVAHSPAAAADLESLSRIRGLVRDLPQVDPPFGFYEAMLSPRRQQRARRYAPRAAGAFVAAAAAIVVIVGVIPVADSVVPPVNAFAERHMHMITPASAPSRTTTLPGTVGSSLPSVPGSPGVATPGTVVQPPAHADGGSAGGSFDAVSAAELDQMGAPPQVAGGYKRMGGYQSDAGVLHVMYTNGTVEVSVYEQHGTVAWSSLPTSGTRMRVGDDDAWAMTNNGEEVVVVERGTTVYTAVAVSAHDDMMNVVQALPPPPPSTVADRARQTCRSIVEHFGFDQ